MTIYNNQLHDYIAILNEIPGFNELTAAEIFLLGYCVNKCEGKATVKDLAEKIIRTNRLFKAKLLNENKKNMVEYFLFKGMYEGVNPILDAFSQSELNPVERIEKAKQNSLPPPEGLIDKSLGICKRFKAEDSAAVIGSPLEKLIKDEYTEEIKESLDDGIKELSLKKFKSGDYIEEEKVNEQKSIEYIKKLQEEDEALLRKQRELKEKEEADKVQCAICMDMILPEQYNPLEPCGHLLHTDCIKRYLEVQIDSNNLPLVCPILECKIPVDPEFTRLLIDDEKFKKFDQFSFQNFIEGNSDEYSCCPTPNCSYVFVWLASEDSNDFTCPKCKGRYCLNCRCIFHKGMTCKEYTISNTHTVTFRLNIG
jgi:hypothetical protein